MRGDSPAEARVHELLEARARALAKPPQRERPGDEREFLAFSLGGERYGIELRHVVEVFRLANLSPLPGAAAPIVGITPWRGDLLPILDLRRILALPAQGLDDLRFAIVLGEQPAPLAVLADALDEVLRLGEERVRPAPEGVAVHRDFVRGITEDAVLVLDAERLLETHR